MLKKKITYTNFNDQTVTEDLYFNLSASELIEMEVGVEEGFGEYLERIVKEVDKQKLFGEFKRLILMAYGKKSADGERFEKSDDIRKAFEQSAAYDAVFLDLVTGGADTMGDFINGVIPKDLSKQLNQRSPMPTDPQDPAFVAMQAAAKQSTLPTSPTA